MGSDAGRDGEFFILWLETPSLAFWGLQPQSFGVCRTSEDSSLSEAGPGTKELWPETHGSGLCGIVVGALTACGVICLEWEVWGLERCGWGEVGVRKVNSTGVWGWR